MIDRFKTIPNLIPDREGSSEAQRPFSPREYDELALATAGFEKAGIPAEDFVAVATKELGMRRIDLLESMHLDERIVDLFVKQRKPLNTYRRYRAALEQLRDKKVTLHEIADTMAEITNRKKLSITAVRDYLLEHPGLLEAFGITRSIIEQSTPSRKHIMRPR